MADTLVLLLPPGASLRAWRDAGVETREWAWVRAIAPLHSRVVIAGWGSAEDEQGLLHEHEAGMNGACVEVLAAGSPQGPEHDASHMARLVRTHLEHVGSRGALVRTVQLMRGEIALRVRDELLGAGLTAGLVARGGYAWTRMVAFEHGTHSPAAIKASQLEARLCQGADLVVGTTRQMVDELAWRYCLDPARIGVVPNFVLPPPPQAAEPRESGLVLTGGRLESRKRVELLIGAVAQLVAADPSIRLEVMGDGPARAALEREAQRLRAPVRFLGTLSQEQMLERMSRCTIYAQTSELEVHPRTVLQAMACGATVVVADAPGLAHVIHHGVSGLRCEADPDSFAQVIQELLGDAEWREILGSAAARLTLESFGLERVVQQDAGAHGRAMEHALLVQSIARPAAA